MAANLIPQLPSDTQVWQEINESGQSIYYLVYKLPQEAADLSPGLENFTLRYKVKDLKSIAATGTVTPDVVVTKNGEVYSTEGRSNITVDDYTNSFYFGDHTQLATIHGGMEAGAVGYEYFIEALEQESKYKPYIFSKNAAGQYDYLAVALEAAKEGRTARESELAQTTWWKKHTATERQEMSFAHKDPASFSQRGIKTREEIIGKMLSAGITELDPAVIDAITQKKQYGIFDDTDINNTINKLANPLIRFTLDP